ncbi:hypothetical protein BC830DRAFT_1171347 [Chytriomyces sp. MP71]|nr:hypothetical protein BC830DRAFT_1171347 [Chytriomyces sp. MP71]
MSSKSGNGTEPTRNVAFNQSTAVSRDRNAKEQKLGGHLALVKLADEESTIHEANLKETRDLLYSQLHEQVGIAQLQSTEAEDVKVSFARKVQFTKLVDKVTAMKAILRFQEEARERELALTGSIRQKRAAFQVRLVRLEQRQVAERNELSVAQKRLADSVLAVREIELKSIKDKNKLRRIKRENEMTAHQVSLRQQKGVVNNLELANVEEMEEIHIHQRQEEFDLNARHIMAESELQAELESRKEVHLAQQLQQKQIGIKASLQKSQKRQAHALVKVQRDAARGRERALLADHTVISGGQNREEFDFADDSVSEGSEATTQSGLSASSLSELGTKKKSDDKAEGGQDSVAEVPTAEDDEKKIAELNRNSVANKGIKTLSEAEKEILAHLEQGNQRKKSLISHQKNSLNELKHQHRNIIRQKSKEQYRKMQDLLKEHQEEIEQLKLGQEDEIKALMETHIDSEQARAETVTSENLNGSKLPAHIIQKLEMSVVPEPESFKCITIFFTDIHEFSKLAGLVSASGILKLLNSLYSRFDDILSEHPLLYKVEYASDSYMVAAGLSAESSNSVTEFSESAREALRCARQFKQAVQELDVTSIVGHHPVQLRIGMHSGPVNAGLIGTARCRYRLFGDTVQMATQLCSTCEAGKIQVSPHTIQILGEDDDFEFVDGGEITVSSIGNTMTTYWLLNENE